MKNILKYSSLVVVSALFNYSCKPDLKAPEATAGTANFSKYIAVGNSLTAGFADGGLYLDGQKVAFPNLIAEQIKLAGLGANDFTSPFFPEDQKNGSGYRVLKGFNADGTPKTANVQTSLALDFTRPNPIAGGFYFKPYTGSAFTNFGIPGIRLTNIDLVGYGTVNPYMDRIAGANKLSKYIDWVAGQSATFFSCWLGNNDVLGYATNGGVFSSSNLDGITQTPVFASLYELAIAKLTANGAKGIVATIPDVTAIAFLNTVKPSALLVKSGGPAPALPGVPPGSKIVAVYVNNAGQVTELTSAELITLTADSIGIAKTNPGIPKGFAIKVPTGQLVSAYPLANNEVLDVAEQELAKAAVTSFNQIITSTAAKYNLALFDANGFFNTVKSGIVVDGTGINPTYISGGAFSMDGVHLTPRGNALAANGFIDAINAKYGSNIPKLAVTAYDGVKVK